MHTTKHELAIGTLASTDAARPELHNVHLRADGAAEVTDGHIYLKLTPPGATERQSTLVPAKAAAKFANSAGESIEVSATELAITMQSGGLTLGVPTPQCPDFPACDSILPTGAPIYSIHLSPILLAKLMTTLAKLAKSEYQPALRFDFFAGVAPARITGKLADHAVLALIMPIRPHEPSGS